MQRRLLTAVTAGGANGDDGGLGAGAVPLPHLVRDHEESCLPCVRQDNVPYFPFLLLSLLRNLGNMCNPDLQKDS
jgi:hypothetical protein